MSDKKSLAATIRAQFKVLEERIDELDEQSKVFDASLRKRFEEQAPKMRDLIHDGAEDIDHIEEMDDQFDKLKSHADFTVKAIKTSVDVFVAQFKSDDKKPHNFD